MRPIPATVTDPVLKEKLLKLGQQIEAKMQIVNGLRDQIKKTGPSGPEIESLKKIGSEIDQLDQEWKSLLE
jgi:hypothetical protein